MKTKKNADSQNVSKNISDRLNEKNKAAGGLKKIYKLFYDSPIHNVCMNIKESFNLNFFYSMLKHTEDEMILFLSDFLDRYEEKVPERNLTKIFYTDNFKKIIKRSLLDSYIDIELNNAKHIIMYFDIDYLTAENIESFVYGILSEARVKFGEGGTDAFCREYNDFKIIIINIAEPFPFFLNEKLDKSFDYEFVDEFDDVPVTHKVKYSLHLFTRKNLSYKLFESYDFDETAYSEFVKEYMNYIEGIDKFQKHIAANLLKEPYDFYHDREESSQAELDKKISCLIKDDVYPLYQEYSAWQMLEEIYKRILDSKIVPPERLIINSKLLDVFPHPSAFNPFSENDISKELPVLILNFQFLDRLLPYNYYDKNIFIKAAYIDNVNNYFSVGIFDNEYRKAFFGISKENLEEELTENTDWFNFRAMQSRCPYKNVTSLKKTDFRWKFLTETGISLEIDSNLKNGHLIDCFIEDLAQIKSIQYESYPNNYLFQSPTWSKEKFKTKEEEVEYLMYYAERFVLYVYQIMESYEMSEDEDDFLEHLYNISLIDEEKFEEIKSTDYKTPEWMEDWFEDLDWSKEDEREYLEEIIQKSSLPVYSIYRIYENSEIEDDFFDWMHERYDELYNPKYDASWKYRRPTPKQGFAPGEIYQTD